MRVYMRKQDGEDKYVELDHKKAGFMSGDIIITSTEQEYHELSGMLLFENVSGVTVKEPAETYSLEKAVSALVFFTKLPHSVSIKRSREAVRMMVTM